MYWIHGILNGKSRVRYGPYRNKTIALSALRHVRDKGVGILRKEDYILTKQKVFQQNT